MAPRLLLPLPLPLLLPLLLPLWSTADAARGNSGCWNDGGNAIGLHRPSGIHQVRGCHLVPPC
jgi:hypothetical protein